MEAGVILHSTHTETSASIIIFNVIGAPLEQQNEQETYVGA